MKYKEIDRDLLIRKRRIAFELGESTLPKYAKKFIERVLDSEELTPTFSETEIRSDEREKVLNKAYDMLADELMWVLHDCGDDVYLGIADSIRTTFGQMMKGESENV